MLDQPDAAQSAKPDNSGPPHLSSLMTLLLLTIVGGAFRFATIMYPGIWYDEAQTYRRVCGTFSQLMQQLRSDGFMPLHYWIEWGLAQLVGGAGHLTPFWLRLPAALAGTLMVPAMYWLARHFSKQRTSLLVAAFTACSAYLNFYSHDAKMYMPLWLMCALSMSCFLTWQRNGKRIAWIGWLACSIVMIGFHATGAVILALQAMMFLATWNSRRRHRLTFTLGIALIVIGPLCYYVLFNRWAKNIHDAGWEGASGLHWIPNYNAGRTRPQLLIYPLTAYLTGWEWPAGNGEPRPSTVNGSQLFYAATHGNFIPTFVRITFEVVIVILFMLAGAGLVWAMRAKSSRLPRESLWLAVWLVVPMLVLFELATHPNRLIPFHGWAGIWMPRYLGFVWPAGAILICSLLSSLPSALLRRSAIVLLLAVNCVQSICHVTVETRPPTQRMMQDVWEARDDSGASRTYLPAYPFDPEGGDTVLPGAGKFYLCMEAGRPLLLPDNWLKTPAELIVPIHPGGDPALIAQDVIGRPAVRELTVWRAFVAEDRGLADLERLLGLQWKKTSDETFHIRGVWNWSDLYICRRCRYIRSMSQ